jgi:hypothetical protein
MLRRSRVIGRILLAGAIAAMLIPVNANARGRIHHHGVRRLHEAHLVLHATATMRTDAAQPALSLPPMRYYGGPKCPMWRG